MHAKHSGKYALLTAANLHGTNLVVEGEFGDLHHTGKYQL